MLVCTIFFTKVTGIDFFLYLGYAAELQQFSINFLPIVRVPAELTEKGKNKDRLLLSWADDPPSSHSLG
jgi:hypothetical protein